MVADGGRDTNDTRNVLLPVQRVAPRADRCDLRTQLIDRRDAVLGTGRQACPGDETLEPVVGVPAEHDLADAGGVHRDRESHPRRHPVRLVGVGPDQVDDLVTVDHTDMDGAVHVRDKLVDEWLRDSGDVNTLQSIAGEGEDLRPGQVAAVGGHRHEVSVDQGGQDAVGCCLGQPGRLHDGREARVRQRRLEHEEGLLARVDARLHVPLTLRGSGVLATLDILAALRAVNLRGRERR